jgi:N-acetylmuramic acid 6-phosphate etherase
MNGRIILGIECGGTKTIALAATSGEHAPLARVESGPANLRLISDADLTAHFESLRGKLPAPDAVGVGMAGVRTADDRARVARILERVWPGVPSNVDHDLVTALEAASLDGAQDFAARVIVLSGTGSCCFGRNQSGQTAKAGGWGHLLGDQGSGYEIAHSALRMLIGRLERTGATGILGPLILRSLMLNDPEELVGWMQGATKRDVAALTPLVFQAVSEGDGEARAGVVRCLEGLLSLADIAAGRLVSKKSARVEFVFAGSVFSKQPKWVRHSTAWLKAKRSGAQARVLERESAWGAVVLGEQVLGGGGTVPVAALQSGQVDEVPIPKSTGPSPTELRNPRSTTLDRMPVAAAIELMLSEEAGVPTAILTQKPALARLIQLSAKALKSGGRLFYAGAGTSGRLGVLDASECPPTFRTPPEWVQGIMAGGEKALHSAVEGAEDNAAAGATAILQRAVTNRDVVVGIAASGRTPFVWGALATARKAGARTAIVCFNPNLEFARGAKPNVVLAVDLGPEVLTGSTRLKAGTATKLILNCLTTLTMVRLGKVAGNLMVDLNPSNVKLRDRAARIVVELTGVERDQAWIVLEKSGWVVKDALASLTGKGRTKRPPQ